MTLSHAESYSNPRAHPEPQTPHPDHHPANRPSPGTNSDAVKSYQSNFKPNCTCRDEVEVLVITPAVGETPAGVNTTAFGVLKFA